MTSQTDRIICFTAETQVLTALGERPVCELSTGDRILTADHGLRPIRWIGHRTVEATPAHAPVSIPKKVLGASRDLVVSPEHRVLLNARQLSSATTGTEVLVRAADLVGSFGVKRLSGGTVTYYHLLMDHHELLFAEGVLSESFHPAKAGLEGVDPAHREELFTTCPDLRSNLNGYGDAVRPYSAVDPEWMVA